MNTRVLLFTVAATFGLAAPSLAGPRDDMLDAMSKCTAVADDKARLACFDALKPQLQAALAAPAPQQVAQAAPPPAQPEGQKEDSSSWFGLDHLFGGRDQPQTEPKQFGSERLPATEQAKINPPPPEQPKVTELDSITATLADYALTPTGRFILFLDNGQVWQQIEGDTYTAHFKKNPRDNTVVISRAFLGSYALKVNDLNQTYKVKRVK